MKAKQRHFLFALAVGLLLNVPALFASAPVVPPVENSAEDLFLSKPATIHSYKKATDLHSIVVGVLALTELEFVRIGDALISLPIRGSYHPLRNTANFIQDSFYRIPQIRPVERVGQLGDALQIRQLSLSDFRFVASAMNGETGGGISPVMQTRVQKLIILVEDLLDDVDQVVMFPVNKTASLIQEKPVRVKTITYAGSGIGYLRQKFFWGLRAVNKTIVKGGSKLVFGVEGAANYFVRHRLARKNKHHMIYVRMPADIHQKYQSYLDNPKNNFLVADQHAWQSLSQELRLPASEVVQNFDLIYSLKENVPASESFLIVAEMKSWQSAPDELRRYVIDQDEFEQFIGALPEVSLFETLNEEANQRGV